MAGVCRNRKQRRSIIYKKNLMPTSRPYHLSWLCGQVLEKKPKSILDIGVGFGSKGMLFREYTDIWNGNYKDWKTIIDGIEIFKPYISELQRSIYNNIFLGNVLDMIDDLDDYDLIYAGDIIEHFNKADGEILLRKLKAKSKTLIIATPIVVSKQGKVFNNPDEEHKSQWTANDFKGAKIISFWNTLVAIYELPSVYYCLGMKFYGEKLREMGFRQYNIDEPTLFLGLYFREDYEVFKSHKSKRYVFWNGSDIQRLFKNPEWIKTIKETPATHACHNEQLRKELEDIGIEAKIRPIFFGNPNNYPVSFKHGNQVYSTAHPTREKEYGVDTILETAREMPEITFHIYGIGGKNTENVIYHWQVEEEKMDNEIKDFQGCLRLNKHDGLSQIVIKAGLMGQYPIMAHTKKDLIAKLKELKNQTNSSKIKIEFNNFDWLK